ncbi:MAG: hypothetical protein M1450_03430 [Patescibacteria group bacterium]|nr:hypothetical protein [Patescibacteria group bacterium]
MKIIVTHNSPDWDAIAAVWLIKRFLPNWADAEVKFVPAGDRIESSKLKAQSSKLIEPIGKIGEDEVIHVDTGLGALDHHQTESGDVSSASLTFDFIKREPEKESQTLDKGKQEVIERMVRIIVDVDHFKEVFWDNPTADYHEFSFLGILEGIKLEKPGDDLYFVNFGMECLDAILHNFENRLWAEKEIKENGRKFETKWGKGIGIETINDAVLKLAQKMGYVVVVRRDPRKGYVRVKARPSLKNEKEDIDLTGLYEKLKKMDPDATWFLHVSKKMLLNGTAKNPKMKPTKLSLDDIIKALETI